MQTAKIDGSDNVSNGRLQEFKNNGKLLTVRPKGDGRLQELNHRGSFRHIYFMEDNLLLAMSKLGYV